MAWYHLARSGLLIVARILSAVGCFWIDGWYGLLFRLTCHMPDVFDRVNSNTRVGPILGRRLDADG